MQNWDLLRNVEVFHQIVENVGIFPDDFYNLTAGIPLHIK